MNLEKISEEAHLKKASAKDLILGTGELLWELTKYGVIPMAMGAFVFSYINEPMLGAIIGGYMGCMAQDAEKAKIKIMTLI